LSNCACKCSHVLINQHKELFINPLNKSGFRGDVVCDFYDIHNALSIINSWLFRSVDSYRYLHADRGQSLVLLIALVAFAVQLKVSISLWLNRRTLYVGRANTFDSKSIQECRFRNVDVRFAFLSRCTGRQRYPRNANENRRVCNGTCQKSKRATR